MSSIFFFQAEDGIRDLVRSRGLGDVYKRQGQRGWFGSVDAGCLEQHAQADHPGAVLVPVPVLDLSLIHI